MCEDHKSRRLQIANSFVPDGKSGTVVVMRRIALLALLPIMIASCSNDNKGATELFPVRMGVQYGYMDRKGEMVIPAQYSQASCFVDGLALTGTMRDKIRWGYIDKTGKYLIYPAYTDATSFSEGIAFVVSENGEPVAIDKNGTPKFTVKDAEQVQNFRGGLAAFSVLTESGEKWGFVDKEGDIRIPPRYAGTGFFSDGFCPVMNDAGKWGFINTTGDVTIDYKYDNVMPFYGKEAKVYVDGKWGIIESNGRYLLSLQYDNIDVDKDKFLAEQNDKFGWLDKNGKELIAPRYDDGFPFNDSKLAAVKAGDKWGYIDGKGNFVINPQFDFAFGFDGDIAPVRVGNKIGFIDKTGKLVIAPKVDDLSMDYYLGVFAKTSAFNSVTTNNNTPKYVGYKWLIRFYHLQFDEAKAISTEETKTLLTQFASLTNMMPDSSKQDMMKIRVGIQDCIVKDSMAVVNYITSDNPGKMQALYLMNNEGNWLVQFSKNDAVAGDKNSAPADTAEERQ